MSRWIDADEADRQQTAYMVADEQGIPESSVEKDWWVTAILKVLFSLKQAKYMTFKGGTSLSKGWNIINRFSEDIDVAFDKDFYHNVMNLECAKVENNNQIKKLRIANRDYVLTELADDIAAGLIRNNLSECKVVPINHKEDGTPSDHDNDPVVIEVHYPTMMRPDQYVRPVVKIEISCLSMKEPYETKRISSMIGTKFPDLDDETYADIPTVMPSRTFLEKAFLLNEEYQKSNPRTNRMSRHLYDLERLMDTCFASDALSDMNLYNDIIMHRKKFYHVGKVVYENNLPPFIRFCPEGEIKTRMELDYNVMKETMIYGEKLPFSKLMERLEELQNRFRQLRM